MRDVSKTLYRVTLFSDFRGSSISFHHEVLDLGNETYRSIYKNIHSTIKINVEMGYHCFKNICTALIYYLKV